MPINAAMDRIEAKSPTGGVPDKTHLYDDDNRRSDASALFSR
jgi:hypothetical protein